MKCFRCLAADVRRSLICRECRTSMEESGVPVRQTTQRLKHAMQLAGMGQLEESAYMFYRALAHDPHNRGAFESLMVLYGTMNRYEEAADILRLVDDDEDSPPLLRLAVFYHRRNLNDHAEVAVRRLMEDGERPDGLLLLGMILRDKEEWSRAAQALRKAVRLQRDNPVVYAELGHALLRMGEVDKARVQMGRALSLDPDNAAYHYYMATIHEARGDLLRASKSMRVAAAREKQFRKASVDLSFQLIVSSIQQGKVSTALQEWDRCTRDNAAMFAPAFLEECHQFLGRVIQTQHFHHLISQYPVLRCLHQGAFRRMQELFVEASRLVFCLGLAHQWFEDGKKEHGFRAFPPLPLDFIFEEWMNLHNALSAERVIDRPLVPLEVYELLLSVTSQQLRPMHGLLEGAPGGSQGRVPQADDEELDLDAPLESALGTALWAVALESHLLTEALRRCRSYSDSFFKSFHEARDNRESRDYQKAISAFERAVASLPKSAALRNMLWNLYIREERFSDAVRHCRKTLSFTPHKLYRAAALNDMAYCLVEMGAPTSRALSLTRQAQELAPSVFDHHIAETRAWAYYRDGRFSEALDLMEKVLEAIKDEPPSSVHYYHYGKILLALGRDESARHAFQTALQMEVDADTDWGIARKVQGELDRWAEET